MADAISGVSVGFTQHTSLMRRMEQLQQGISDNGAVMDMTAITEHFASVLAAMSQAQSEEANSLSVSHAAQHVMSSLMSLGSALGDSSDFVGALVDLGNSKGAKDGMSVFRRMMSMMDGDKLRSPGDREVGLGMTAKEVEAMIEGLIESNGGIDDIAELSMIMQLLGLLGHAGIPIKLQDAVSEAVDEFVEMAVGQISDPREKKDFLEFVSDMIGQAGIQSASVDALITEVDEVLETTQDTDVVDAFSIKSTPDEKSGDKVVMEQGEDNPVDENTINAPHHVNPMALRSRFVRSTQGVSTNVQGVSQGGLGGYGNPRRDVFLSALRSGQLEYPPVGEGVTKASFEKALTANMQAEFAVFSLSVLDVFEDIVAEQAEKPLAAMNGIAAAINDASKDAMDLESPPSGITVF